MDGFTSRANWLKVVAPLACCLAGMACVDGASGGAGGGGNGGSGEGGSGGAGFSCAPSAGNSSFKAGLGAWVSNAPWSGDGPVTGSVWVSRDGHQVYDAAVTVNGVAVPPGAIGGAYAIPSTVKATFGDELVVCASEGEDATSLSLRCPSVAITWPTEGTEVSAGETLTVTWTGDLNIDGATDAPNIAIYGYDRDRNTTSDGREVVELEPDETSAALIVPPTHSDEYIINFKVPGGLVRNGQSLGACGALVGVHLTKR